MNDDLDVTARSTAASPAAAGLSREVEARIELNERALDILGDPTEGVSLAAVGQIDFLDARADAWMAEADVQRMFNAMSSVFEKWASQEIMDRFRVKLGEVGRQCFIEGALRTWLEISEQQRRFGAPLPSRIQPAAAAEKP